MAHLTWQDVEALAAGSETAAIDAWCRMIHGEAMAFTVWEEWAQAINTRMDIVWRIAEDLHFLAENARQAGATEQGIQRGAQPYVNALAALLSVTSAEFWLENAGAGLVILEQTLEL